MRRGADHPGIHLRARPLTDAMDRCTWALQSLCPLKRKAYIPNNARAETYLAQTQVLGILLDPAPSKKWVQKNKTKNNQSELGPLRHGQVLRDKDVSQVGAEPLCLGLISGAHRAPP